MKNKCSVRILCLLAVFALLAGTGPLSAEAAANTVGEVQSLIDGIVDFKLGQAGASSVQGWIDSSLSEKAGISAEWYVVGLSQSGSYDFTNYQKALGDYLAANKVVSATSRQKYALALIATGSTDAYISTVLDDSIGQLGIMSWVYGLHLLNNGYVSDDTTVSSAKEKLLSLQFADGGWALKGDVGDIDVTAMVIQALAPYYHSDSAVRTAVDAGLALLSSRQLETGDYASYGVPNPESTAQVLVALSGLGIDCTADERFIKNGNTLIDGICLYRLSDGSFSHKLGEASNETATIQAFYSLVSYLRMADGKGSFHVLDRRNPAGLSVPAQTTAAPQTTATTAAATTTASASAAATTAPLTTTTVPTTTAAAITTAQTTTSAVTTTAQSTTAATTAVTTTTTTTKTTTAASAPVTTVTTAVSGAVAPDSAAFGYKPVACLIIAGIAGAACLVLLVTGKRHRKNFLAVLIVAAVAVGFVLVTDFQSTESYYSGADAVKHNAVGTVTMTIRCDTVAGKSDEEYIPEDGVILAETVFSIEEGDTAYTILTEAAQKYGIQMENTGAEGMVYIAGINYLYEFDFGDLSGWMYHVNGAAPSVGCDQYVLSDGDVIEWLYTCDMGDDVR